MNKEAATKLTRARISLIMKQPFIGTLALRLRVEEHLDLPFKTLGVNGTTMFYDPQWVLDNDFDVVMAGVGHEVGHCMFDHIGPRRNGREKGRWNQAGDYVINAMLKDSGFTLGDGWLYNPIYAGLSTDQVYNALPPIPPGSGGGSGAFDEIMEKLGDDVDPELSRDDWQIATIQAANAAQAAGNLPAAMKRFVTELTQPKADWRSMMRRFMTEESKDDYTYARLNRKFSSLGIYLPGLYSERMGEIDAAIDTSGSISGPILAAFGAELNEIKNQMNPTMLRVIYCDAAVNHVDEYEEYEDPIYEPHGGGGTSFLPPFALIEKEGWEPKCFCYLTDGLGPYPKHPPPYPVLWLMTTDVVPPWGEHVRIEV